MSRFGVLFIIILFSVIGVIVAPHMFFTPNNLLAILEAGSLLGIVAVGVAFVTIGGNYCDLSVPGIMAFAGIIAVQFLRFGIVASIIAAILAGILIGCINGFMVGKLRANPIIWCLSIQFLLTGILRWVLRGTQLYPDMMPGVDANVVEIYYAIYRFRLFGVVPVVAITFIALALLYQFILSKSLYGQRLRMTGSNVDAAKCSGINTSRIIALTFIISGISASIGGLMLSSLSRVGAHYLGEGYDFSTVTAIVLGGVTLLGGRGNIFGVVGGVFSLGMINNIMTFLRVGIFERLFFTGLIFIFIVWFNSFALRKLGKDYV